ncbi:MAG: hypothetical protein HKN44_06675 [Ilumatobacter sp.]|nr:hypothetical protein [Ilumatobacter sp.]
MSGEANGLTIDLDATLDRGHVGEVGVPAGPELLAFTNAVELGGDIDGTRAAVAGVIGEEATIEAAAIVAIFNGLVRVADGTGIQLDAGVFAASIDERQRLGIDAYAGAANSLGVAATSDEPDARTVVDLFR